MLRALNIRRQNIAYCIRLPVSKKNNDCLLKYDLGLLKNHGSRCENRYIHFATVSVDPNGNVNKKVKKKTKPLITDVINVTSEAVTRKLKKVTRLNQSNFLDRPKQNTNVLPLQKNMVQGSSAEDLLKIFHLTNSNRDFFQNEFQDTSHNEDYLKYLVTDKMVPIKLCKSKDVIAEENMNVNIVNNVDETSINRTKPLPPKNIRKGISKEAMKRLIDQMKSNSKIYSFNSNLEAFISVCNQGNSILQKIALKMFIHFASNKRVFQNVSDIKVYNEALKCLEKLTQHDVKVVTSRLKNSSIQPDVNTFALILSCLGRRYETVENLKSIKDTLAWMKKQNVSLVEMFSDALFPQDSLKYCIKAVCRVDPKIQEQLQNGIWSEESMKNKNRYQNELLKTLNDSLFANQTRPLAEGVVSLRELEDFTKEQLQLELKGFISIPSITKSLNKEVADKNIRQLKIWENEWRVALHNAIESQKEFREQNFLKCQTNSSKFDTYPYFSAVNTEDLVNLLILEINKLCSGLAKGKLSAESLHFKLGCQVYKRYLINCKRSSGLIDTLEKTFQHYNDWYLSRSDNYSYVPRIQWDYVITKCGSNVLKDSAPDWPYPVKRIIGQMLYKILISTIKIYDPNGNEKSPIPAFTKIHHQEEKERRYSGLEISPILLTTFKITQKENLIFCADDLPMVVPPVPWTNTKFGGYLITATDFIRHVPHAHLQNKRIAERNIQQLYPIVDSLNQLGSIPWRINEEMLDFIIKLFNDSGWEELDLCPPKPSCEEPTSYEQSMTKEERKSLRFQKWQYKKKCNENYSIWCDTLYKLSLANFYRNRILWLPQNIDFRGRTYPIPPHLTHLSADLFRSTLLFAQGKKLGNDGLKCLKLHVINLSGLKKRCGIQERIDYADEVLDDILDSAENPLNGRKWWAKSDEPWQTLAVCKELSKALKSENPEEFVSHLPVHQDGSCNGLQHYAALGRDIQGAKSVNLRPSSIPQDIYSDVVTCVEEKRKRDAEEGLAIAIELDGYVIRKVIKQTIMTTVYGVTRYGAQLQIERQLKYMDFPSKKARAASRYLATTTFESLGKLFSPTKDIQNWLVTCADGLSHLCLQHVEWITPLGLPVVQPYTKVKPLQCSVLPGQIPLHYCNDQFAVPNRIKQKNAFAPNFVHSLDASHMMLTSIFCQHAGISFVSIHDCFWTHACTVPIMSKICREQFVQLHSQPLLEDLSNFMGTKVEEHKLLCSANVIGRDIEQGSIGNFQEKLKNIPKKGTFDLNEVKESIFFFS